MDWNAVDLFGGQDLVFGAFSVYDGDHIYGVIEEVGVEFGCCGIFHVQVHLLVQAGGKGFYCCDWFEVA